VCVCACVYVLVLVLVCVFICLCVCVLMGAPCAASVGVEPVVVVLVAATASSGPNAPMGNSFSNHLCYRRPCHFRIHHIPASQGHCCGSNIAGHGLWQLAGD
jgi:hypothetical protein